MDNSVTRKELLLKQKQGHKNVKVDQVPYFFLHNVISMVLFFFVAYCLNLFNMISDTIMNLFTDRYLPYYATVLFLMVSMGIISRIITYFLIMNPLNKFLIKRGLTKQRIISFIDLNDGINKVSFGYMISSFINAFFFTIGALYIIQVGILKSTEFYALILSYILMKLLTFLIMKLGRYAFLNAFTGIKI